VLCEVWVSIYIKYIYNPFFFFFLFFLNRGVPILKEVAALLMSVIASYSSSYSFNCLGSY
jgi:hypothetical protein